MVYFRDHFDAIRLQLTREPRGHRDLLAALLIPPVNPESDFGLIYMDARRYPFLCGHATIGAVATCLEAGWIQPAGPETPVIVDTPSGPMETLAFMEAGRVTAVSIRTVPSFVYQTGQTLEVPGFGPMRVETVCVGGFFVMASAKQLDTSLEPENSRRLIDLGMEVIEAANRHLSVQHPLRPEVRSIDVVEFYDHSGLDRRVSRSVVIYGEGHMDRSPCGTGTAATLTLLHHRGHAKMLEPFTTKSPLDTAFEARIVREEMIGEIQGVVVEIKGSAHITGTHNFLIDPSDPLPEGYLI
jgi:proline racemase